MDTAHRPGRIREHKTQEIGDSLSFTPDERSNVETT